MTKAYTANFKEKTGSTSGEEPLYLLEITHPQLALPVRVVRDTLDLTRGHYLDLPGIAGNYASTPDSAILAITGDLQLRVTPKVSAAPAAMSCLISKSDPAKLDISWELHIMASGILRLITSPDGVNCRYYDSTIAPTFGVKAQWRVTLDVDDGAGHSVAEFWESIDGAPEIQIGATIVDDGTTSIHVSAAPVRIGAVGYAPMFELQFRDLGNGAVDTTPLRGMGAATATRATTATTVDSNGDIITVSADVMRAYYDPTTLAYRGFLSEGSRTNFCLQSNDLTVTGAGGWNNTDCTITPNDTASPISGVLAGKVTEGSAGTASVQQNAAKTVTAGSYVTVGFLVKKSAGLDWLFARVGNTTSSNNVRAWFNLTTGAKGSLTTTGAATGGQSGIQAYPGGWYLVWVSCKLDAADTTARNLLASAAGDGNTTRVAGSSYWVCGAQIELGAMPGMPIVTTTGSGVRNFDSLQYDAAGNINSAVGSVVAKVSGNLPTNPVIFPGIFAADDGAGNNLIGLSVTGTSAYAYGNIKSGGVDQGSPGSAVINPVTSATAPDTIGLSWQTNNVLYCHDGIYSASDVSAAMPSASLTRILVGTRGLSANCFFGAIESFRIYADPFTAAQLAAVTASLALPDADSFGLSALATMRLYAAEIYDGIGGTVVARFDAARFAVDGTTATMDTGETWTINQSGGDPAVIAADETYTAMNFRIQLPDDLQGKLPRAPIQIDNVGRELTDWIDQSKGGRGAQIRVMQVMRDDPDTLEYDATLDLLSVHQNGAHVTGEIGYEDTLNLPALAMSYRPDNTPGIF